VKAIVDLYSEQRTRLIDGLAFRPWYNATASMGTDRWQTLYPAGYIRYDIWDRFTAAEFLIIISRSLSTLIAVHVRTVDAMP